jgi:enoyl-[acyl-carrier protein] reductase II
MNRVTEILGVKYPIIQAPMGWIARSQLASAVSNAGGFGIIETSSGETENCKAEILAMSKLTDKPFGVNLPLMFLRDESMIELVLEQGIKFVTTSAGDPRQIHSYSQRGWHQGLSRSPKRSQVQLRQLMLVWMAL